jgi:hypothetical protein
MKAECAPCPYLAVPGSTRGPEGVGMGGGAVEKGSPGQWTLNPNTSEERLQRRSSVSSHKQGKRSICSKDINYSSLCCNVHFENVNLSQRGWYIRERFEHNVNFLFTYAGFCLRETWGECRKLQPAAVSHGGVHSTHSSQPAVPQFTDSTGHLHPQLGSHLSIWFSLPLPQNLPAATLRMPPRKWQVFSGSMASYPVLMYFPAT